MKRLLMLAMLFAMAFVHAQDLQRGFRNYQDVLAGRKKLEQLSPQEKQEVFQVHRIIRSRQAGTGKSPECRAALSEAQDAASELADSARQLASCADSEDFEDDCSSEMSRVSSAHDDYETAVSDVESYCQ